MKTHPVPRAWPLYWWLQAAGWGVYFVVNTIAAQSFLTLNLQLISGYFFLSVCGVAITHAYRSFILRRGWIDLPLRRLLPRALVANFLMSVAIVAAVTVYFTILPPLKMNPAMHRNATSIGATMFIFVFNDFIILVLWSVVYFGVAYVERQRRTEIEHYESRTALAEAELRGLRSQLNPHFLFNALNSLRGLVVEDPPRAQSAVTQLAGILRYHLTSGERSLVPLEEELATVEQYLALELMRFEDRLSIETNVEPRAMSCLVPPLAVQTLVENAIKYGVSHNAMAGRIALRASVTDEQLRIIVGNTGTLHSEATNNSTGVGLTNLRTRLRLLFDGRASLELREESAGWVEARLVLPATQSLEMART